jgi:SAM-dependent methyltransferase
MGMASLGHEPTVGYAGKPAKLRHASQSTKRGLLRPFSRSGSVRYDHDTEGMPRRYHTAHAIQNDLVSSFLKTGQGGQIVVDLGCGTANDGLCLLSGTRNVIYLGVDYSEHMLTRASDKLERAGFKDRSFLIERDFRNVTKYEIFEAIGRMPSNAKISSVISAIALHHYDLQEKRRIYELAFDLLPRRGLLVLTDLYSNGIGQCADWAWNKELLEIREAADRLKKRSGNKYRGASTISERHYREENRPQVLSEETSMLMEIGFNKVEVIYRHGQLGVIAIEK